MRIKNIEITNILGVKNIVFAPGTLTVVSGRNGEGKSSILAALLRVFNGGHDKSLLRRGSKLGEIKLVLDDGSEIKVRITSTSTTYEILDATGNEVKAPRSYIEQLGDSLAVDPARLLLAKPKELAATLLEVMPITFTQAELQEVIDENTWPIARNMSLDEVEVLRKQIYDARTTANRQVKEAETTAKSLKSSLTADDDTDWAARSKELAELLEEGKQSREMEISAVDREERDAIEAIKQRAQQEIDAAKAAANEKRISIDREWNPQLAKIREAGAVAQDRMRDKDKAEGLRRSIAEFETRAAKAAEEADHMSAAIAGLDELKQAKLSSLPIPGIEVRDGEVFCDGVAFERINLAERIKIAFSIAALRSGKLPFLILDQAEAFDKETWEEFKRGALASGFQIVTARVSDGPLNIESIDAIEGAAA